MQQIWNNRIRDTNWILQALLDNTSQSFRFDSTTTEYHAYEVDGRGKVSLIYLNNDSKQAYLAMGFKLVSLNSKFMELDPATSPKWAQNKHGEWKLKSNIDKRYMHTAFDSDLARS